MNEHILIYVDCYIYRDHSMFYSKKSNIHIKTYRTTIEGKEHVGVLDIMGEFEYVIPGTIMFEHDDDFTNLVESVENTLKNRIKYFSKIILGQDNERVFLPIKIRKAILNKILSDICETDLHK